MRESCGSPHGPWPVDQGHCTSPLWCYRSGQFTDRLILYFQCSYNLLLTLLSPCIHIHVFTSDTSDAPLQKQQWMLSALSVRLSNTWHAAVQGLSMFYGGLI